MSCAIYTIFPPMVFSFISSPFVYSPVSSLFSLPSIPFSHLSTLPWRWLSYIFLLSHCVFFRLFLILSSIHFSPFPSGLWLLFYLLSLPASSNIFLIPCPIHPSLLPPLPRLGSPSRYSRRRNKMYCSLIPLRKFLLNAASLTG